MSTLITNKSVTISLHEHDTGASYIKQILNSTRRDAMALYEELRH